jgi:hypothetical protein
MAVTELPLLEGAGGRFFDFRLTIFDLRFAKKWQCPNSLRWLAEGWGGFLIAD